MTQLSYYTKGLILVDDPLEWKEEAHHYFKGRIIIFPKEKMELGIDDARELIAESYIATKEAKYLLVCARSFRNEAQNALLKVIEEPPLGICIFLVTSSKSALLPTIRSRLALINLKSRPQYSSNFGMNLDKPSLNEIYTFIRKCETLPKNEAKEALYAFLFTLMQAPTTHYAWGDTIDRAWKLIELNSRPSFVFSQLLMRYALESRR